MSWVMTTEVTPRSFFRLLIRSLMASARMGSMPVDGSS